VFVDAIDVMPLGDLGQNIAEIGFRIQTIELCRLDEGVDGGSSLAA
jgi:hypothetical protein